MLAHTITIINNLYIDISIYIYVSSSDVILSLQSCVVEHQRPHVNMYCCIASLRMSQTIHLKFYCVSHFYIFIFIFGGIILEVRDNNDYIHISFHVIFRSLSCHFL